MSIYLISKKEGAFTIIELIISIFILSIAIIGIFSAFSVVTILTSDAEDRFTATYLAQEGTEIVRNIRDTNWMNMASSPGLYNWDDMLTSCDIGYDGCEADYTTTTDINRAGAWPMVQWNSRPLYKNNTTGFYGYYTSNATPTKFKRKIIITPITDVDGNSSHIIKVIVQVSWDKKATILAGPVSAGDPDDPDPADPSSPSKCNPANCIVAEELLYNWY